ncbi:uracil-DNA glycosylase [Limnohabitans sp. G3-2]|uniref:uracil-DNA glycosylase n=1 Tax=Limnohabitans sp. G3-2 TaxID=1100711 RepID=UPI000C1F882F|nr:uracil-DNA glycosylase [Limnohabitans sp. G3-2]PIT72104.1 uracil-DNA glycosylase [Limnohabitans sp. G3-2]
MSRPLDQLNLALETEPSGLACLRHWPPEVSTLDQGWRPLVADFLASPQGLALTARLTEALKAGKTIYPPDPLRALRLTPLHQVRAVILGQDPYHGPGQAEGLAFSVAPGVRVPPSLRNIFKELKQSLGLASPVNGSLAHWAGQGVLLLNACLTVEEGLAASHARWGWEALTDALIMAVAKSEHPVVFMLWGAQAQAKKTLIETADTTGRHLILQANHPSPLSALRPPVPFLGCGHFEQAARFWALHHEKKVQW